MNKNIKNPGMNSLTDALTLAQKQTQLSINCVKVGIIQSFNPANQRANIQISYKQVKDVLEDGTKIYQEYPVLKDCPVMVLFGGVDILSLPIQAGDNCLVLFNDSDMDQWAQNGNGGSPTTSRMHDLSDAIAIVGIRPLSNVITNYLANGIRLSHNLGNSQIDLKEDLIESIAELFLHNGDVQITGDTLMEGDLEVQQDFTILGDTYGNAGTWTLRADLDQEAGFEIHDGRRVSGTFSTVDVVDGIVVGGS